MKKFSLGNIALAALFYLFAAFPVQAQNTFPTNNANYTVQGFAIGCLNSSGIWVPQTSSGTQCPFGGGGGGAGAVFGPTAVGTASANPPVQIGGTVDGTATGAVSIWKVSAGIGFINCANCSGSGISVAFAGSIGTVGTPNGYKDASGNFQPILGDVTNGQWVAIKSSVALGLNTTPSLANGNGVVPTQSGAVLSATNGGFTNILQGNAVISATNPLYVSPATSAVFSVNPGTAANWGVGATGSAVPASAQYMGIISGGNLTGWTGAVTNAGTFAVQLNSTPSLANGNGVVPTQAGAVLSATNGGYTNILQGNVALSSANPLFVQLTTGAANIGAITNTSFAVTQATAASLNATVVGTGTFAVQATLQASATTAIGKVDPNTIGNWGLQVSTQNSATPANMALMAGQFNTAPTTITSGNVSPLQLDNSGRLIVNCASGCGGSGGTSIADAATFTQGTTSLTPIGGIYVTSVTNLTAGQAGAARLTNTRYMMVDTPNVEAAVGGAAAPTNALVGGGIYNSSPITVTNTNAAALQLDVNGYLKVNVQTALGLAAASTTSGQTGSMIMGAVTTAAPSYTTAQTNYASLTLGGALREDISSVGSTALANFGSAPGAVPAIPTNSNTQPTENHIGETGSNQITTQIAQTVTASAYTSGNALGGLMTITGASRNSTTNGASGSGGILMPSMLTSKSVQTVQVDVFFFNANPTASSCTDKTAFVLAAADAGKVVGVQTVPGTAANGAGWFSGGTGSLGIPSYFPISYSLASATSLYACAVVRGAFTPTSTSDVAFNFTMLRD